MGVLLILAVLDGLPERLSDPAAREKGEQVFGVELFVLSTQFDDGLGIEDGAGAGLDFNFRWQWNGKTRIGFNVGIAGWDSENDDAGLPADDVDIVQYRAGIGAEFPFKVVELGVGLTSGIYRFSRDHEEDASPFVEFEGSLGWRPIPELKIGGVVMATHTESSFNRKHTHLFHNYSAGLAVEISF